ncbi:MAG: YdeI/OmpD-associated family protein [Erythrobacter sp.]
MRYVGNRRDTDITHDPRVDEYIIKAAAFAQPILSHVRALVQLALPEAQEGMKWGMPHFVVKGRNIVGIAAFKAHASVTIHREGRSGEGLGSLGKLKSLDDLPPDEELTARIRGASATSAAPHLPKASKPDLEVPPALADALAAVPKAQATFAALAPSHRREYIEWITDAKRDETRARRVAQAVEWLADGRKRNWKYENS